MQNNLKDNFLLTPDSANQLRKDFIIEKAYLEKPKLITSITPDELGIMTVGVFSFLSFFITFFLIAETLRSLKKGTS
ncbi:hypothetical protein A3K86_03400 [Photobacterium jeanii]|uniref:Uncharacterized protein n=1 Tax=Photobacterium jeanii TaxID=858640 RepID=A0A178KKS1_9GAMM|nr:hypothetical protein [Photobacterium jeanii]OAN17978.1 hypothetical protein A3K86_03400 [Photobacterium jeanii]PST92353.1 hypothetical protein C9I91_04045 [Photobacterium jeanii]